MGGFGSAEQRVEYAVSSDAGATWTKPLVVSGRDERTVIKLVVDMKTGKVLGVHILGPDAAEIVQMAAVALRLGATKADLDHGAASFGRRGAGDDAP